MARAGRIRRARPCEAAALSRLAVRSKAYWGYDAAFLAACRDELRITPACVARSPVYVCEAGRGIAGFFRLDIAGRDADVGHFFVAPAHIGRRVGARIAIESDPSAAGFYARMGARRVGSVASESIANRRLPLLEYSLADTISSVATSPRG